MSEPRFFTDVAIRVPMVQRLMHAWQAIVEELTAFTASGLLTYVDYPKYTIDDSDTCLYENEWKVIPTTRMEGEVLDNLLTAGSGARLLILEGVQQRFVAHVRRHMLVLDSIVREPEEAGLCANGFISRIQPGTMLRPHRGWTPNWLRVHMGLATDPLARLTVGDETRTWTDGQILAFRDGGPYPHSVEHKGTRPRVIVSIDLRMSRLIPYFHEAGIDPQTLAPFA